MPCFTIQTNTRFTLLKTILRKTYALGTSYEGFTFIRVCRSKEPNQGKTKGMRPANRAESHHSLASRVSLLAVASSYSPWRAWGRATPLIRLLMLASRALYSQWRVSAVQHLHKICFKPKISITK
jgi:hypothetical protein